MAPQEAISAGGSVDPRIADLASVSVNFGFLLPHLDLLVLYGAGAENVVFTDPNIALIKSRQFGEALAGDLVRRFRLRPDGDRQIDLLRALEREGVLHGDVGTAFNQVRTLGNKAAHSGYAEQRAAFEAVKTCFRLGVWFDRLLTGSREPRPWVPPTQPWRAPPVTAAERAQKERLDAEFAEVVTVLQETKLTARDTVGELEAKQIALAEARRQIAALEAEKAHLAGLVAALGDVAAKPVAVALGERTPAKVDTATREAWLRGAAEASREPLTEAQVRVELDRMLADSGWDVQDNSPYTLDLVTHQGVAVREVTVGAGRADYMLYVDQKLVGIIEAKKEGADLTQAELQADQYVENLTSAQRVAAWGAGRLPFRYASDGGRTYFRNALDPDSRTRQVFSFHRPETFALWLREAAEDPSAPTFRARLKWRLPELEEDGLRLAQVEAVNGLERSLKEDRPRALIQMATGAGKTYTAVTFGYRLAKYARARKILFLVDRNNLGTQAAGEFENYVIPGTLTKFPEEYNVQRLANGAQLRDSTKVVVCTIQRLWMALSGKALPSADYESVELDDYDPPGEISVRYNPDVPPETFDLIVVDECHRSIYGKWRSVLEYFDAHLVGLTATPVAQTYGFFNRNIVSEYTYQQAVADGVNVDFSVYRIKTQITEQGSTIEAKTVVPTVDRRTRRQKYEELDADYTYSAEAVGNAVLADDQIRLVVRTFRERLYTEIFPERASIPVERLHVPKTLVFAKNDLHADRVVEIIRTEFGKGNDFCKKITHKADRAQDLINAFRNSPELRIAVTVDMIATGTDVKAIECLMFLRDVRSWAYFEQMKGRGARTLSRAEFERVTPDVPGGKTQFVIVDAIGVTEHPQVDASPLEKKTEKNLSLEKLLRNAGNGTISPDEVSTLAARLAKLNQQITDEDRAELEKLAGQPLKELTRAMVNAVSVDEQEKARGRGGLKAVHELAQSAVRPLAGNPQLRSRLLEIRRATDVMIDEVSADTLTHAGAVVTTREEAADILAAWRAYIAEHREELEAFNEQYQSRTGAPGEIYSQVKRIVRRLERPPHRWTPESLWRVYAAVGLAGSEIGVRHGAADLVTIIRYELGVDAELKSYREIVEQRYAVWLEAKTQAGAGLTETQRWWLRQIADATAKNVRFDPADLDHPPFTRLGGTDGYLAAFGDEEAVQYLAELDQELHA